MKTVLLLFLFSISLVAQTTRGIAERNEVKGIIKDSLTGKPISYVNIWVENENIGTTAEEDGSFSFALKGTKNIVFSALGYETKIVLSTNLTSVSYYIQKL